MLNLLRLHPFRRFALSAVLIAVACGAMPIQERIQAEERSSKTAKLTAERVAVLIPQIFKLHLRQREIDLPLMRRLLKDFVNQLDLAKTFLLKSESEALCNVSDDELKRIQTDAMDGDFSTFQTLLENFMRVQIARDEAFYEGLDKRLDDVKALIKELDKDKSGDSTELDKEEETNKPRERAGSNEEREKMILKDLSYYFRLNKTYLSETDSFKMGVQALREEREKWKRKDVAEATPKLFFKSFMNSMDPHTDYFDAEEDEEFSDKLERSFAGIGVQIRQCLLGAQVQEVIKGGPADKSKKFAPNDQIIAVDDFPLAGLSINKVVKRIKGKIGTEVKLSVLKYDSHQQEAIVLKRDTIELSEMRVKGKKYDTESGPIALISVASFYREVHKDVLARIQELSKDAPLAGVVLDLRSNHGGYLDEAVNLTGLFINHGPVVGERDGHDKIDWRETKQSGADAEYTGPLVVLVNQFSASASEIVAGTLRDYSRAIIVGHTNTFGKGTVQRVIPLSVMNLPGEIKITTHQYFLAGGDSVQLKGVAPDVIIPGFKLESGEGMLEASVENSIPFNKIPGKLDKDETDVKIWSEWKIKTVPNLQKKSELRVAANPEINDAFDLKKLRAKARIERENLEKKPLNPEQAPDAAAEKKDLPDVQADEAVQIVNDMAATWPGLNKQVSK